MLVFFFWEESENISKKKDEIALIFTPIWFSYYNVYIVSDSYRLKNTITHSTPPPLHGGYAGGQEQMRYPLPGTKLCFF